MLNLSQKTDFPPFRAARIEQAVILAAGLGSRLAQNEGDIKPLKTVGGLSLIQRNISLLAQCGIKKVVVVTGYHAKELQKTLSQDCAMLPLQLKFAYNPQYRMSNGLSVLAAQTRIKGNFLLMMADHIFEPSMMQEAMRITPPKAGAVLLVDYKLREIFDMNDATKVLVQNGRVCAISKTLEHYNAVDTGLFVCTPALMQALRVAQSRSPIHDCSLSEGVAALVETGRMFSHDIGNAHWQDVDDDYMLAQAELMIQNQILPSAQTPSVQVQRVQNPSWQVAALGM
ncbi:MAG: NTP transferase domain-containing protein [Bradymonadales bacterium]|jgi:choline kinase